LELVLIPFGMVYDVAGFLVREAEKEIDTI